MQDIYLLLGSNLGDRETYLNDASILIATKMGSIESRSSVYETAPWGKTDQPAYLNQVIHLRSVLEPQKVLETIVSIEKGLGREKAEKWAPRNIDIDILFYGDQIVNEPGLIIPHPYLHLRNFTLAPLNELIPEFNHPVLDKSINNLYCNLKDKLSVRKIKD